MVTLQAPLTCQKKLPLQDGCPIFMELATMRRMTGMWWTERNGPFAWRPDHFWGPHIVLRDGQKGLLLRGTHTSATCMRFVQFANSHPVFKSHFNIIFLSASELSKSSLSLKVSLWIHLLSLERHTSAYFNPTNSITQMTSGEQHKSWTCSHHNFSILLQFIITHFSVAKYTSSWKTLHHQDANSTLVRSLCVLLLQEYR